jgi:FHS family glucose/mannose:H+ symporter-like MFS transporter
MNSTQRRDNERLMRTIYYAFFSSGVMGTLMGAILPSMKAEYGMSYVLSGNVISAHQVGNFIALIVSGYLPLLVGRKRSTVLLVLGIPVGFLLMTLTGNPLLLILSFALAGVGKGTKSNIANVVTSEIAIEKSSGLNLLHAFFAIGAFVGPFLALFAISRPSLGWRYSAWIVVLLEVGVILRFATSSLSGDKSIGSKGEHTSFLTSSNFWLASLILFFYLCGEISILGWLVTYFIDTGRLTVALAQVASSVLWVCIFVGRLICAALVTKMDKHVLLIVLGILQLFFFILMIWVSSVILIFISLLGFGLALSGTYPTVIATMDRHFTNSTVVMGTTMAISTLGAIIMPTVVGAVAQQAGIAVGLATITISFFIMVGLIIFKYRYERKHGAVTQ